MGLLEYKDIIGGISDVDLASHTIKGYASVFGNVDSDNDIIERGAYSKTIKEWGPQGKNRIKMCWQHDLTDPIAKTNELFEDNYGLAFVASAIKGVAHIDDRIKMIEGGIVDEVSVGIVPVKTNKGTGGIRHLTENKLYEYSSVTLASNELARITAVKGMANIDVMARLETKSQNIMKMLRDGTLTDEAFHTLEFYHNQLLKHISDLLKPSADTSIEPSNDTQSAEEIKSIIKNAFKN
ncbi:HK97 family phage prohead protease [Sphingobacterium sp. UT-1RO-CII-1]|uniref:HK97 family phage prohead protease n=1 Tax=Sphingobacterium sp. UT-1RO-CII-1 TaxID=2995225 RepID=UPI00227CC8BF|nr:HK97 family phage prohead protease [Sphingobacterium sp. UT-1RO-CII-1]